MTSATGRLHVASITDVLRALCGVNFGAVSCGDASAQVETEARLLLVWKFPIEVARAVGDEVDTCRAEEWKRVGQESSSDSCVPVHFTNHE